MPSAVDDLKRVPLFSGLNGRQLRKLASRVSERHFKPGRTVLKEGSMGGIGFFVVTGGEASVSIGGKEVATLSAGDHFGELALVSRSERTATITARTELRCLEIAFSDFREFAHANPDVTWRLLQDVVAMLEREKAR
ncbi:MAG TPA: cyclic nucleotide-binding domain-containing protein [Gaiellaceae bacterium]|jgi:CRP-like cAMP-binding protein|nr:cyclic nucleotide-binding domain-containing protein [Gaiellaceae bacterium]